MSLLTKNIWRNYPPFFNTDQESGELYTITESLRQAIEEAKIDAETGKKMMYLLTAEGKWVDKWGAYFGVGRWENEDDEKYKQRIIWEVIHPRQTIEGLKQVISYYSGLPKEAIEIYEYFRELKPVDFGAQADENRTVGIEQFNWCVINIITPVQLNDEVKRKVEETKAFGVKVYYEILNAIYSDPIDSRPTILGKLTRNDHKEIPMPVYIADFHGLTDGQILKYIYNSTYVNSYDSAVIDAIPQFSFTNVPLISFYNTVIPIYDYFANKTITIISYYADIFNLSPVKYVTYTDGYGNEPYGTTGYGSVVYYSYIHTLYNQQIISDFESLFPYSPSNYEYKYQTIFAFENPVLFHPSVFDYNHKIIYDFETFLSYFPNEFNYNYQIIFTSEIPSIPSPTVSNPQIKMGGLGYGADQYGICKYGSTEEIIYL